MTDEPLRNSLGRKGERNLLESDTGGSSAATASDRSGRSESFLRGPREGEAAPSRGDFRGLRG